MKKVNGVNVAPGVCAICHAEGDTIQADCHVLYKGEWINQLERVCPSHVGALVKKEKAEPVHEKKEEEKPVMKAKAKPEAKAESTFYAGKNPKR